MLSRRLIRVKVFKVLFGRVAAGNSDALIGAENELMASCEKTRDLYILLMRLPVALKRMAEARIEQGLQKFHPTEEEANPNYKFVNNRFTAIIENDLEFLKLADSKGLGWDTYDTFIKKLYLAITSAEYFKGYMNSKESSLEEDTRLFYNIFASALEDNEDLEYILEETNVFWMNDLEYVLNKILENINKISKKKRVIVPDTFRKEDDITYAKKLLTESLIHYDEYVNIVAGMVPNWDKERLVATDLALIVMGITEAVVFNSIPLKVTINEYVDISKFYSTPNSRTFVNGILDKILQQMVKDGRVVKSGRGLVGSN